MTRGVSDAVAVVTFSIVLIDSIHK